MDKKKCFIIMPFGKRGTKEFSTNKKIYTLMIKPVVESCGYDSVRADEITSLGNITRDIIEHLYACELVIADLSGWNANVFYELGVRHALKSCGTIPIIREGEPLPFDVAPYRVTAYSMELDGPEEFKKELEQRIKTFDIIQQKYSDNAVHDFIGDRLEMVDKSRLIDKAQYEKTVKDLETVQNELKTVKDNNKRIQTESQQNLENWQKDKETIKTLQTKISQLEYEMVQHRNVPMPAMPAEQRAVVYRNSPKELTSDDVSEMIISRNFYDTNKNKNGVGVQHQYNVKTIEEDKVVIDDTTGLVWQQSGSDKRMDFRDAQEWVKKLNQNKYAGYSDWRLPTLEEAMSLMEPSEKNGDLHIDPVFDKNQRWIWTCDKVIRERGAWVVTFSNGDGNYVRAVRS